MLLDISLDTYYIYRLGASSLNSWGGRPSFYFCPLSDGSESCIHVEPSREKFCNSTEYLFFTYQIYFKPMISAPSVWPLEILVILFFLGILFFPVHRTVCHTPLVFYSVSSTFAMFQKTYCPLLILYYSHTSQHKCR